MALSGENLAGVRAEVLKSTTMYKQPVLYRAGLDQAPCPSGIVRLSHASQLYTKRVFLCATFAKHIYKALSDTNQKLVCFGGVANAAMRTTLRSLPGKSIKHQRRLTSKLKLMAKGCTRIGWRFSTCMEDGRRRALIILTAMALTIGGITLERLVAQTIKGTEGLTKIIASGFQEYIGLKPAKGGGSASGRAKTIKHWQSFLISLKHVVFANLPNCDLVITKITASKFNGVRLLILTAKMRQQVPNPCFDVCLNLKQDNQKSPALTVPIVIRPVKLPLADRTKHRKCLPVREGTLITRSLTVVGRKAVNGWIPSQGKRANHG